MRKSTKFFPEVRERAVRLVSECRDDHPSQWAAVVSISGKIGCTAQTLLSWVRRHERNTGQRQGLTSAEQQRIKELEREVKELRKANEILKLASTFFALDGRPPFAKRSLHSGVNGKTAAHRSGLCRGHRLGP